MFEVYFQRHPCNRSYVEIIVLISSEIKLFLVALSIYKIVIRDIEHCQVLRATNFLREKGVARLEGEAK